MLNTFYPSAITTHIYDILEGYEIKTDVYESGAIDAIADYLDNYLKVEHQIYRSDWPNEEGGVCGVAFIDKDHPQLIMFDYKY